MLSDQQSLDDKKSKLTTFSKLLQMIILNECICIPFKVRVCLLQKMRGLLGQSLNNHRQMYEFVLPFEP